MLKGPKDSLNLHGTIFVIFFDHSESKSARKALFCSILNLETVFQHIDTR